MTSFENPGFTTACRRGEGARAQDLGGPWKRPVVTRSRLEPTMQRPLEKEELDRLRREETDGPDLRTSRRGWSKDAGEYRETLLMGWS